MSLLQLPSLTGVSGIVASEPKRPLLIPHDLPDEYILQIDNSTMEKFQTCPRSAEYYCVNRRERPGKAALVFGGAIHEGLEAYYKGDKNNPNLLQFMIEASSNYFIKHTYDPGEDYRTPAYAADVLAQYYQHRSYSDDITPIDYKGSPAVEMPFALNIGCIDLGKTLSYPSSQLLADGDSNPLFIKRLHIQWTGKIDLVGTDSMGRIHVVDHKTSSIAGGNFFLDFEMSQQTRGYTWAIKHLLDITPDFFTVNALFVRKPTRTGKGVEFGRSSFHYDEDSLTEWHSDTMSAIESFVHSLIHANFPKYTKWCIGKYGQCPYFNVCKLHSSKRPGALASNDFVNVTWSPLV